MGRSSDPQKETALEALFQVMKNLKIAHRPGPSHDLFFMVKNAIHLWKTAHKPSKSKVHLTGKVCIPICDDYWDKQQLSAPENKKTRDLLLQTISTWFDRRSKKSSNAACSWQHRHWIAAGSGWLTESLSLAHTDPCTNPKGLG